MRHIPPPSRVGPISTAAAVAPPQPTFKQTIGIICARRTRGRPPRGVAHRPLSARAAPHGQEQGRGTGKGCCARQCQISRTRCAPDYVLNTHTHTHTHTEKQTHAHTHRLLPRDVAAEVHSLHQPVAVVERFLGVVARPVPDPEHLRAPGAVGYTSRGLWRLGRGGNGARVPAFPPHPMSRPVGPAALGRRPWRARWQGGDFVGERKEWVHAREAAARERQHVGPLG